MLLQPKEKFIFRWGDTPDSKQYNADALAQIIKQ